MTEILVVDDHPLVHEILPHAVRKAFGEVQVHAATDLNAALERAAQCKQLQLVLLDLTLPGCSGIDALVKFRDKYPQAKIVVFSATEDPQSIQAAFATGAVGYIPKTSRPDLMVAALRVVAAGGKYVPSEILGGYAKANGGLELTERQLEVLRLMLRGLSNRQIAERLEIAEGTVKQHATDIYQALAVTSRAEAIAAAHRRGLTSQS
jgi:DNA-binding NarL/FixJ family response regulator